MLDIIILHHRLILLALLISFILSLVNRACANMTFETGYGKGFLNQGTLFGMLGGLFGVLYIQSWSQFPQPNINNDAGLRLGFDDEFSSRWRQGLGLIQLGLFVIYYHLLATMQFMNPEITPEYAWIAGAVLVVWGYFRFRNSIPPVEMMPLVEGEDFDEPKELVEWITGRYKWAQVFNGSIKAEALSINLFSLAWLLGVFGLGSLLFQASFQVNPSGIALILLGVAAALIAKNADRRFHQFNNEGMDMETPFAETDLQREFLKQRRHFVDLEHQLEQNSSLSTMLVLVPGVGMMISFFVWKLSHMPIWGWTCLGLLVLSVLAIVITIYFVDQGEELTNELERMNEIGVKLEEEVEEESFDLTLKEFREESKKSLKEYYNFGSEGTYGYRLELPEHIHQRMSEEKLSKVDRRQLQQEREISIGFALQVEQAEAEKLAAIRSSRLKAGGVGLFLMLVTLANHRIGSYPESTEVYFRASVLMIGLWAILHLPEIFQSLRLSNIWKIITYGCGILVFLMIIVTWRGPPV